MKVANALLLGLAAVLSITGTPAFHAAPLPAQERWSWPSQGPSLVSRAFDPPAAPWLPGHRGVDLLLDEGTPVLASADGTVVYAGLLVDRPVVSIRHPGGLRSTYEPVEPTVTVGETVRRGQAIGVLTSGHDTGALHWGAKIDDRTYIDPLLLVLGPATLKPWDGPADRSG